MNPATLGNQAVNTLSFGGPFEIEPRKNVLMLLLCVDRTFHSKVAGFQWWGEGSRTRTLKLPRDDTWVEATRFSGILL